MILPVVQSILAIALSVELAGQCTSPVPSQTATRGLAGVPKPVTVTPSTEILTIGLARSVLSVFNHVTVSTEPLPPLAQIVIVAPSEVGTPVIVAPLPATKLSTPELFATFVPFIRYSCH